MTVLYSMYSMQVGYFEEKEICLNDCIQWQVDYFERKNN